MPNKLLSFSICILLTVDCSVFQPPARVDLQPGSHLWYETLKDKIRHQQSKPVWVSEVTVHHTDLPDTYTHVHMHRH